MAIHHDPTVPSHHQREKSTRLSKGTIQALGNHLRDITGAFQVFDQFGLYFENSQETFWMNGSSSRTPPSQLIGMSLTIHQMKACAARACVLFFCWNHVNPCYINILFVHLMLEHMCFLLATLAACKGLLRCVPALQMNFMRVNMKFAVNMLIDFVCYILFNTAGREFYSSVSKHPEQSQWPSEALGWLTF